MSDSDNADTPQELSAAEQVIERFGGIRSMAHKLDVAVSTVQGWKQRKHIPDGRREQIGEAAKKHEIDLEDGLIERAIAGEAAAESAAEAKAEGEAAVGKETPEAEAAETPAAPSEAKPAPWPEPSPEAAERELGEQPQPASGSGGFLAGMVVGAIILVVGVGVAVVTRSEWLPLVDAGAAGQSQAVSALSDRLDKLEQTSAASAAVEDLQANVNSLNERVRKLAEAGPGDAATKLAGEVDGLGKRVEELAATLDAAPGPALRKDVSELQKRVGDLGQQVSSLDESAAAAGRVDELAGQVDKAAGGVSALEEKVAGLSQQMEELGANRQKLARDTAADVAVALAIGELRDSLRIGRPYASDLAALNALLPPDSPLMQHSEALGAHAESGVVTRAALRRHFDRIANDAVAAAAGGDRDDWIGDVINRLGEVVSVRPVGGEVSGDNPGALIAQAEAALENGDLNAAVSHATRLTGEPAAIVADWLKAARARLAAEQALSQLTVEAMDTLGGRVTGTEG